jgi:hypothetical protein
VNALIPALLAVVLAEIGGPLASLARDRPNIVGFVAALLVCGAAAIGASFVDIMIVDARTLMLGVVLMIAATGQFERAKPRKTTAIATGLTLWRSPAPFLAFALAAWSNSPVSVALGGLFGMGAVTAAAIIGVPVPRSARIGAGGVLLAVGAFAALSGLHLL